MSGKIVLKGSIKAMQALSPVTGFLCVHVSFMGDFFRISRLEKKLRWDDAPIPWGRSYAEEVGAVLLMFATERELFKNEQ